MFYLWRRCRSPDGVVFRAATNKDLHELPCGRGKAARPCDRDEAAAKAVSEMNIDFPAYALLETEKALKVRINTTKTKVVEMWIPKSFIHDDSEVYDAVDNRQGKLVLEGWAAKKLGL